MEHIKVLISNFRRVLNIVCILLDISPASDCCLPTFRNPLSVPSSRAGCRVYFILYIQPLKMELIEGSETSANNNWTPGKYPKKYIQHKGPLHMSSVFCQELFLIAARFVLLVPRFSVSQAKCSVWNTRSFRNLDVHSRLWKNQTQTETWRNHTDLNIYVRGVKVLRILNLNNRWRWVVSFT